MIGTKECPRCQHTNDINSAVCWVCKWKFGEKYEERVGVYERVRKEAQKC